MQSAPPPINNALFLPGALNQSWLLFEITRGCNRSCVYCYNPDRQGPRAPDLSASRFESLLDRLFDNGPPRGVTIIGGEPLLVPQLDDVIRGFARRGLKVGLSTNGLLLDRARIEALLKAGVGGFEVSLDSSNPATHGVLTGAGGIEQVREALAALALAEVPVSVGAVLTRPALAGLDDLLRLCFALSVGRIVLAQFAPVGQARAAELCPSPKELATALELANQRSADLGMQVCIGLPVEPCRLDRDRFAHLVFEACRCGIDKWVLEPNGNVRTCELAETSVGNLFETPFGELVSSETVEQFRRNHRTECTTCPDWDVCGGGCRFLR